jgi:ABC-type glycerol-3-phosphate transport system permease component
MTRRWQPADWFFHSANYLFMAVLVLATLYPFIYVLATSLSDPIKVMAGEVWLLPIGLNLDAYDIVLRSKTVWNAYGNTIFYVVAGTSLNVVLTMLGAYPLSRRNLYGRGFFSFIIVFTMFFGAGMIPNFLLVKELGMLNTRWALILPGAISAWLLIMTRTYLQANIPDELVEAAQMDGASDLTILWRLVVPLSLPILAVIALFYGVGHWNEYVAALIYLRDVSLQPLQVILRQILLAQMGLDLTSQVDDTFREALMAQTLRPATTIVATVPVLLFYPFLQRYFVKGMLVGSLKG